MKLRKTDIRPWGNSLINDGFTLIELLAVIVILAIIALIATPIILGIIKDTKKSAAEASVQNYLKAVDIAIMNKEVTGEKVLDGSYSITLEGKLLDYPSDNTEDDIDVEFEGQGLTTGTIIIEQSKVKEINDVKIGNWVIENWKPGEQLELEEAKAKKEEIKVTLVSGQVFNAKIKTLANNGKTTAYDTEDTTITSIEFYSNGKLPKGYSKTKLNNLANKVDVSLNEDGLIIAYYEDGKVYVVSDNLISFNEDSSYMFYKLSIVNSIQFNDIDTSQVTDMSGMFENCNYLKMVDIGNFDTSKVTDMKYMFCNCNSLTELDLNSFNTSKVTEMQYMFYNCKSLNDLNLSNFNLSSITDLSNLLGNCTALKEIDIGITEWNTNDVIIMSNMFKNCSSLTMLDVSSFNTENVTNMSGMFDGCSSLISLDVSNFNTNKVTSISGMFGNCNSLASLDISNFNVSNVKSLAYLFSNCTNLTSIKFGNNFDTTNVTNMEYMFSGCSSLINLDLSNFNTTGVTTMIAMFIRTSNLETINIGCDWVTSTNNTNMFTNSNYTQEQFDALVEQKQASCSAS